MKTKLLILDRDGVLNVAPKRDKRYITEISELSLNYDFINNLKYLDKKIAICVVSNQQGVSKGLVNQTLIKKIEIIIQRELSNFNISITRFYYCFHLEEENCNCRKPKIGNFIKAMEDFEVSPGECMYIGDENSDEKSASAANILFYYVKDVSPQLITSL